MLTAKQRAAVAAYHWWSAFFVAVADHRPVFLLTTHQQARITH